MNYRKDDRVLHPKRSDWGLGQVLANSAAGQVRIFFSNTGFKTISLDVVEPVKVTGQNAKSVILDRLFDSEGKKLTCGKCNREASFDGNPDLQRVHLGWCDRCFRKSFGIQKSA